MCAVVRIREDVDKKNNRYKKVSGGHKIKATDSIVEMERGAVTGQKNDSNLTLFLSLCVSLSLSLSLCVCVSHCLCVCVCSVCLSHCLCVYLSHCLCVCLCVCPCVCLCVCLCACLCVYLSLSFSPSLFLSLCLSHLFKTAGFPNFIISFARLKKYYEIMNLADYCLDKELDQ